MYQKSLKKDPSQISIHVLMTVFFAQVFLVTMLFWPAIIFHLFGYSPINTGILVTLAILPSMLVSWIAGKWSDRRGIEAPLFFFLATIPIFLTSFIVLYAYPSILTCFLSIILFTIPFGGINTLLVTLSMLQSHEGELGTIYGRYTMMRNLGSAFGVFILERVLEHNHVYQYAFWMLFIGLITSFFAYRFFKTYPARA